MSTKCFELFSAAELIALKCTFPFKEILKYHNSFLRAFPSTLTEPKISFMKGMCPTP